MEWKRTPTNRSCTYAGVALLLYSILLFTGGFIAFVKKGSIPSFLMSGFFSLSLVFSSVSLFHYQKKGVYLSFSLLSILELFFAWRYFLSFTFFPSLLFLVLTTVCLTILIVLYKKSPSFHT